MLNNRIFLQKFYLKLSALVFAFLILLLWSFSSLASEGIPLRYPIKVPKIQEKTREFLDGLPVDSASSFWVYFTDKGIGTHSDYKKAIDRLASRLNPRSLQRRRLRGKEEVLDFTDLEVSADYVNEVESRCRRIRVVSRWLNAASVEATRSEIEEISEFPFVRSIEKVVTYYRKKSAERETESLYRPPDKEGEEEFLNYGPSYPQLAQIHVPELHRLGYNGEGILVCMLDTGYEKDHPVFKKAFEEGRVLAEYDFINQDDNTQNESGDPWDQHNHGTCTWSALGGELEGQLYGPAYGASFILAKTEMVDQEIQIEEDFWVAGLEWADSIGADVTSSSLGYREWDDGTEYSYQDMDGNTAVTTVAADLAVSKGIVVVNAAGNEGNNKEWPYVIAPADGDSVIAAGAVDEMGNKASFSSIGPTWDGRIKPDVCARGVKTFCATTDGWFGRRGGTSLSTPLIAGVCALLLQVHPEWDPVQLRDSLWYTASQADKPDNLMGYGIVNAVRASGVSYEPFKLKGKLLAFPNPFHDQLYIAIKTGDPDIRPKIFLFNVAGELVVKELSFFYDRESESYISLWNSRNRNGEEVASGIYLIKVTLGDDSEIYKVAKIK